MMRILLLPKRAPESSIFTVTSRSILPSWTKWPNRFITAVWSVIRENLLSGKGAITFCVPTVLILIPVGIRAIWHIKASNGHAILDMILHISPAVVIPIIIQTFFKDDEDDEDDDDDEGEQ